MWAPVTQRETLADWLGLNRAAVSVLVVIGCLGLAEEIWSNFLSLHLRDESLARGAADPAAAVVQAALYMGVIASLKNLLEGVGYIAGGSIALVAHGTTVAGGATWMSPNATFERM